MKFSQSSLTKLPVTSHGKDLNKAVKKIVNFAYNEDVGSPDKEDGWSFTTTKDCCEDTGFMQSTTTSNTTKDCETEDLKESDCCSIASSDEDSKNSCTVSFGDFDMKTLAKEVIERKKAEKLNVMLDRNDMSKFFRIITNQKYGVPINSSCVVINNTYFDHEGKKKQPKEEFDESTSVIMTEDDKLDVLIYIADDIWHMIHENVYRRDGDKSMYDSEDGDGNHSLFEKLERIELKMTKLEKKLDATLNKFQELLERIPNLTNCDK